MSASLLVLAVLVVVLLIAYAQRKRVEVKELRAGVARPHPGRRRPRGPRPVPTAA